MRGSRIGEAGTVTVATGVTAEEALRAFGADPGDPRPFPDDRLPAGGERERITVLATPEAVLVVEDNHYRGARAEVLTALSAGGRAASMFWNVRALTRLSFAERGRMVAGAEPTGRTEWPAELSEVLAGLDFGTFDKVSKGLLAVERFTGRGITPADLAAIEEAGVAYPAPDPPSPPTRPAGPMPPGWRLLGVLRPPR
ncbi:DUF6461 domain-containing protein [Catenuloplanes atrovinosus]|uniref:Uncharacterized protein n=1 Tax=Catenuloplanes atrovinosus TaxID=137266 RepID=A0AAE4C9U7_9ACTN|nr:DUF6461 domain-containing protein [Catenuloplanes atrovinosus]MDR7276433.1 hypothetical protein [Catenuloplanes atrovinosus]